VPGVRVASHLATYRYRGNDVPDLAQIAAELKIRYVLTGSLRRGGNRIRVIVELADAEAGTVLWSRTYDRDIEDLFSVQEENCHRDRACDRRGTDSRGLGAR
jgi:adenylate cyclase